MYLPKYSLTFHHSAAADTGVFEHGHHFAVVQVAPGFDFRSLRFKAHSFFCLACSANSDVTDDFWYMNSWRLGYAGRYMRLHQ